mmetsp:Transcript_7430/g.13707  ORF Transcript_7430/g.13707 Transcript_7430/m.13707 type:complete len:244 (-) Transcript_7430:93-824(-)
MADKDSLPSASAAAAHGDDDDDMTIAQAMQMVETLTMFGFSYDAANEAVNAVGCTDIQKCCDYILDNGLGVDSGGAIAPISDCPHVDALGAEVERIPADVFQRPCCYYSPEEKKTTATSTESPQKPSAARSKDELDEATGKCPMGENWLCLRCMQVYCSRYVNGHGLRHWEETKATKTGGACGHCVLVGLSDLSAWCHECGAYLVDTSLQPIIQRLQEIKFPQDTSDNGHNHKKILSSSEDNE